MLYLRQAHDRAVETQGLTITYLKACALFRDETVPLRARACLRPEGAPGLIEVGCRPAHVGNRPCEPFHLGDCPRFPDDRFDAPRLDDPSLMHRKGAETA